MTVKYALKRDCGYHYVLSSEPNQFLTYCEHLHEAKLFDSISDIIIALRRGKTTSESLDGSTRYSIVRVTETTIKTEEPME